MASRDRTERGGAERGPRVLRCLDPACRALLAYEVDAENTLTVDLAWTARRDGEVRYFPCPKCHGRNVLESVRGPDGVVRHRVVRFEPAQREGAEEDLTLIPRSVRVKLDRAAYKLHLRDWQRLSLEDRRRLRDAPCDTPENVARYRALLEGLVGPG